MSERPDFKLISVGEDEEDDFVIQAGAAPAPPQNDPAPQDMRDADAPTADADGAGDADDPLDPGLPQGIDEETADLLADASDEDRREYLRHVAQKRAREEAAMVTTEDDLHAKSPFARMRIAIIIVALLLVVAAVYWVVSHPA